MLVNVNIYLLNKLWKIVPPPPTMTTMPVPPAGSSYVLTNIWNCNGIPMQSPPSNEPMLPPGPAINPESLSISGKLKATGTGFVKGMEVFINGVGFAKDAKIKKSGRKTVQKGNLEDGRSLDEAVPPGETVLVSFRNPDGGISTVIFKKE